MTTVKIISVCVKMVLLLLIDIYCQHRLTDLHLSKLIMTVLNFKDVFKLSCVTAAINVSSVGSPDIVNGICWFKVEIVLKVYLSDVIWDHKISFVNPSRFMADIQEWPMCKKMHLASVYIYWSSISLFGSLKSVPRIRLNCLGSRFRICQN